ncbi:MAG: hypothetical protein ACKOAF_04980 [Actinomycetes bacterium]
MNEIAVRREPLSERMNYAKAMAQASLLPKEYRNAPANILVALEYADGLGLSPIAAIQGVHVIDGKPSASAQLIGALVRRAGHRMRVKVADDGLSARATIVRSDDPDFEFESVWTMQRATAAGLTGKGTWKSYPTNLLKARAITEVARDACPEVLSGVAYTPEELGVDDGPTRVEVAGVDQWASEDLGDASPTPPDEPAETVEVIEEAVIVSETPAEPLRTDAQSRKLFTLMGKLNITERPDALRYAGDVIGRVVESSRDLTVTEAGAVIESLEADLAAQEATP